VRMDMVDEGDHYVVRLDIPGAEESEINVSLDDQTLTVETAGKLDSEEKQDDQVIRRERRMGRFRRQVTLPEPVDVETMKTEYEDGVLAVTVEKGPPVS